MKQKLLQILAKPFLGTGIGQRMPLLHAVYKKLYGASDQIESFSIPLGIKFLVPTGDMGPGLYLATQHAYEPLTTQLFIASVCDRDVVFDIGAHVGYYSLLAGVLVGKKGAVIAVEPSDTNRILLAKNIAKNKINVISVINKAISDKDGFAQFTLSDTSSGDNSLIAGKTAGKSIKVAVATIDSLSKKLRLSPSVIKVDVEGAEELVIAGMKQTLQSQTLKTIFIEVSNKESRVPQILQKAGFVLKIIDEKKQSLQVFTPKAFKKEVISYGYVNILAQKK